VTTGHRERQEASNEVSPLELFFDLVFVFAVSQLSEYLLEHLSWRGAAETAVLLIAVFAVWSYTSFSASLPGFGWSMRVGAGFAVLFLALFMNAGIRGAFEDAPAAFAVPFLASRLGLMVAAAIAGRGGPLGRHYTAMLTWTSVEAVLWVIGAAVGSAGRLWWWAAGALLGLIGSWAAHPLPGRRFRTAEVSFDPDRMVERSRLFLLIALGEAVLTTGTAIAGAEIGPSTIATGVLALTAISALWLLYFGGSDRLVSTAASTATDPLRVARIAVNSQLVVLAGLITLAVGVELTIDDPAAGSGTALSLLLFGGPVLYLAAQGWYLKALTSRTSRIRVAGVGTLVIAGLLSPALPAVASLSVVAAVLLALGLKTSFTRSAPAASPPRSRFTRHER
jgi:low temperature requirement protein LtrA